MENSQVLVLEQVVKSYPHPTGAIHVLRGASARFARGETVAILGPSGAGKSSLLALMGGLDKADNGAVRFLGKDLSQMSEEALTRYRADNLGIVFQQFHLMPHLSAGENVALPLILAGTEDVETRAARALADVGLSHRGRHFPHELSGGECQRVAIARALVTKPSLILADEPSGNLDAETGDKVMQLLFDLVKREQTTLILVTHNEALAALCDRRLYISHGQLLDKPAHAH